MKELDSIIYRAETLGATDILISGDGQIHFRIDRDVVPATDMAVTSQQGILEEIFSNFPKGTVERYRQDLADVNDVDCGFNSNFTSRVRANIYTTVKGLEFAIRLIPKNRLTAEQIGIPTAALDAVNVQSGLFLTTGISGSGKTTTIAAILDTINNTKNKHILTIEDPIEYVFENRKCVFSQREILTHSSGYDRALRSAVRENADIILIGEMRDFSTVKAAIELAETGHLVISTLHTRNTISSIDRILSITSSAEATNIRAMLSTQLVGILSQSLLPLKAGGLIASFEFLKPTDAIRNLIREERLTHIYNELQTGGKLGMCTMEQYLYWLVERDLISMETAMTNTSKPNVLEALLKNGGLIR